MLVWPDTVLKVSRSRPAPPLAVPRIEPPASTTRLLSDPSKLSDWPAMVAPSVSGEAPVTVIVSKPLTPPPIEGRAGQVEIERVGAHTAVERAGECAERLLSAYRRRRPAKPMVSAVLMITVCALSSPTILPMLVAFARVEREIGAVTAQCDGVEIWFIASVNGLRFRQRRAIRS